jgi:transcriptional regulator with XRE-family HTH domain
MRKHSRSLDTFRERLQQEMKDRGLSQRQLAESVGLSRPWVTNFMNGKVSLSIADAEAISEYLGVSLVNLIQSKSKVDPSLSSKTTKRMA